MNTQTQLAQRNSDTVASNDDHLHLNNRILICIPYSLSGGDLLDICACPTAVPNVIGAFD